MGGGRGGDGVPESEERKVRVVPTDSSFLVLNVGR